MFDYAKYLRLEMFPHDWCPGCGYAIVMKSLIRAIDRRGLRKNDICLVSGSGCSSRFTDYVDVKTLRATHGRPIACATGVKRATPALSVIVVTGGADDLPMDEVALAARDDIDLTVLAFHNVSADRVGGRLAPTTWEGAVPVAARRGDGGSRFDLCKSAVSAGADYIARGTSYHTQQLDRLIEGGIRHPGFALIEILENCSTHNGRPNKIGLLERLQWERDNTVNVKAAERMTRAELEGKVLTGLLHQPARGENLAPHE